jgi:hypothetical protein
MSSLFLAGERLRAAKLNRLAKGAGIEEAPVNNTPYARQDGAWTPVLSGGGGGRWTVETVAGTSRALTAATPARLWLRFANTSGGALPIPTHEDEPIPLGTEVVVEKTSDLTVESGNVASGGVYFRVEVQFSSGITYYGEGVDQSGESFSYADPPTLVSKYAKFRLTKLGNNEWHVEGVSQFPSFSGLD